MVFLKSGKELVPHVGSPTKVNKNKKGERNVYVVHSNCMKNIKQAEAEVVPSSS